MGSPFHGEAAMSPRQAMPVTGTIARNCRQLARRRRLRMLLTLAAIRDAILDACKIGGAPTSVWARRAIDGAIGSRTTKCGEAELSEWTGVAIALASSGLGGTAAAITRYLAGTADPITLAILRWGIGFLCVLPAALFLKARWPQRRDWPAVVALGFCFFGVFFVFYNIAMTYTTAARASLALATLPLHTMVVGALLGIEPLTLRKSVGVGIAVFGVFAALASGLSTAPDGAWRGELIMTGA